MPTLAPPKKIPTAEDNAVVSADARLDAGEQDDFHLRCLIDEMVRAGTDERTIVRALGAATRSGHAAARTRGPRRSLRAELRRLVRLVTQRRTRARGLARSRTQLQSTDAERGTASGLPCKRGR